MSLVSIVPRSHRGFFILARSAGIFLWPIFYFHFSIFDRRISISIPTLGDTHVPSSSTGPQVLVSFHLLRRPPMPHSPLPQPSTPLLRPRPQRLPGPRRRVRRSRGEEGRASFASYSSLCSPCLCVEIHAA